MVYKSEERLGSPRLAMPSTGSVCFLKYDGDELVGVCGVYVDDFIIAGKQNSKTWQHEKEKP